MTAQRTNASTGEVESLPTPPDESKTKEDDKATPTMRIKVYSPFKTYFDADGYSISAVNATGPFDILPHHHNFLTLLSSGEMMIQAVRGGEQRIRISGGLMHVKADKVTVFLDI
jgi:F0F1-type ATP synthase epsilon subunit